MPTASCYAAAMIIRIRRAEPADVAAIRRCAEAAYAIYVPRIGKKPAPMVDDFADLVARGCVDVATDDGGRLLGYVVAWPEADHLHLSNVAVAPEARGIGAGRALIDHVEAAAHAAGFLAVRLYTNAKMTENQALYPRLGYRETRRAHEDGFDRVFYEKLLRNPRG